MWWRPQAAATQRKHFYFAATLFGVCVDATLLLTTLAFALCFACALVGAFLVGFVPAALALWRWWTINLAQRAALHNEIQSRYLGAVHEVAATRGCTFHHPDGSDNAPADDDD